MKLEYYIDTIPFSTYNVKVSASKGLIEPPPPKKPESRQWPDEHGSQPDLYDVTLQERKITLNCFITGADSGVFTDNVLAFLQLFNAPALHHLRIDSVPPTVLDATSNGLPLVFMVYLDNYVQLDKRWKDGQMVGTLILNLIEPTPMKTIFQTNFENLGPGNTHISMSFDTDDPIVIYWGDESAGYTGDYIGTSTPAFTFVGTGPYYPVATGRIEKDKFQDSLNPLTGLYVKRWKF